MLGAETIVLDGSHNPEIDQFQQKVGHISGTVTLTNGRKIQKYILYFPGVDEEV